MSDHVILLSIPGLRRQDLGGHAPAAASWWLQRRSSASGPQLSRRHLAGAGEYVDRLPAGAARRCGQRLLLARSASRGNVDGDERQDPAAADLGYACTSTTPELTSAVWFPMLSKECGADYICMPAPIHNPDGSESLWCYTRPMELYGQLRDSWDIFPCSISGARWPTSGRQPGLSIRPVSPRNSSGPILLSLPAAPGLRRTKDRARQPGGACKPAKNWTRSSGGWCRRFPRTFARDRLLWLIASEYTIVPGPTRAVSQSRAAHGRDCWPCGRSRGPHRASSSILNSRGPGPWSTTNWRTSTCRTPATSARSSIDSAGKRA